MLGLVFSPIAAAMAFLITYEEYRHHYPGRREPLEQGLRAAVVTFVVFMLVALVVGFVFASGVALG